MVNVRMGVSMKAILHRKNICVSVQVIGKMGKTEGESKRGLNGWKNNLYRLNHFKFKKGKDE